MRGFRPQILASIAVALAALAALAADRETPPERIDTFLQACKRERSATIHRQERAVAEIGRWARDVKSAAIRPSRETKAPDQFNTADEKQRYVEQADAALEHAKALLAKYKSGEALTPPALALPPKTGDIGILARQTVRVVHVVDPTTMLVELSYDAPVAGARPPRRWFFQSAPQPTTAAVVKVVVRGVSTMGLNDNTAATLDQVFEVTGTAREASLAEVTPAVIVLDTFDMQVAEAQRKKK